MLNQSINEKVPNFSRSAVTRNVPSLAIIIECAHV